MDFTKLMRPFDNNLKYLNENKNILIFVLAGLGIYLVHFNESITNRAIELYSNNIFKLIIFIIITYVSGSSPAIGISLAIMILISFQIITNKKLRQDLEKNSEQNQNQNQEQNLLEKFNNFSEINPSDTTYLSNEFLTNPFEKISENSRSSNLDLDSKLVTPTDISIQMLNEGKLMLDDSEQMATDLKTRFDMREQEIAEITRKTGKDLIESGLNRMQQADLGEYNSIYPSTINTNTIKFVKYENNPDEINDKIAKYNELLKNYKILLSTKKMYNSSNKFNNINQNNLIDDDIKEYIEKININQFELLEKIYNNKKNKLTLEKQQLIENQINQINSIKKTNGDWAKELKKLISLI